MLIYSVRKSSVNTITSVTGKIFKDWEAVNLRGIEVLQKSSFHLKASTLSLAINISNVFFEVAGSFCSSS